LRDEFSPHEFLIRKQRELLPFKLSLEQEKMLTRFAVNGMHGWSTLYDNISTSLRCTVRLGNEEKVFGLARAAGYAQSPDAQERREVYLSVRNAWQTQQESCASILNALAGWRLDENELRSRKKPFHFLDASLHKCRIDACTLETMMSVVEENLPLARHALDLKAKSLEVDCMAPWDLFAPFPEELVENTSHLIPFVEAIELVRQAFADISPEMGEFVTMMHNNQWIEGQITDTKRPGAFCTRFAKSRNPRVYMTYKGTLDDVGTLAHELGHAFHNWVMRDLPLPETWYPMTLAETASILAETVVSDVMLKRATTTEAKRKVLWGELGSAEAFLMNIPARFWFECELYKARRDRTLSPSELCELMRAAWHKSYGNSLSEMNEFFWCSKLHFHMSSNSFYNYPYTFGYLFALGVYAQREKIGPRFYSSYVNLLRDTGRLTAEDLALKHLNVDLRKPQFWKDSVAIIRQQIEHYMSLS
jgi:oligoendopeptidase F